jgi:hypothetical protein
MKQRTICKGFTVAVILLFVGLGVQPAVADKEQKIETEINDNEDDLGFGLILCNVYSKIPNPAYPDFFPFEHFFMPATGTIITCKDLDTGNIRIGMAKYGWKLFKFLPIGHDYKIECFGVFNWEKRYINNLNGFVKILIMP